MPVERSSYRKRRNEEMATEGQIDSAPLLAYKAILILTIFGGGSIGAAVCTLLGFAKNQGAWEDLIWMMAISPAIALTLWIAALKITKKGGAFLGLSIIHNPLADFLVTLTALTT